MRNPKNRKTRTANATGKTDRAAVAAVALLPKIKAADKEQAQEVGIPWEPTRRFWAVQRLIARFDHDIRQFTQAPELCGWANLTELFELHGAEGQ